MRHIVAQCLRAAALSGECAVMRERAHHHDHDRDFERRCPPGHIKNGKC